MTDNGAPSRTRGRAINIVFAENGETEVNIDTTVTVYDLAAAIFVLQRTANHLADAQELAAMREQSDRITVAHSITDAKRMMS